MPKGYWVVNLEVGDPDVYGEYRAFVQPFLAVNGGRFVVRGGRMEVTEGQSGPRIVVVEFSSYEQAQRVYHSAEYQAGMQKRLASSTANFVVVEGIEA